MSEFVDPYSCDHPQTELRLRKTSNGTVQARKQCLVCGYHVGGAVKRPEGWQDLLPFDEDHYNRTASAIAQRHLDYEKKREAENVLFWKLFNEYICFSDEWEEKRVAVLKRANFVCEGCLKKRASHVHHLTYKHVFNELAYELRALCPECHEFEHSEYDWKKLV